MGDRRAVDWDRLLAETATRQHGVLSRFQCQQAGVTEEMIYRRLANGRWQRLLPGTYATFSGPAPRNAMYAAALLYAGTDAVLSHLSAAELAGLVDQPAPLVHVTIPGDRRVQPASWLVVHRSKRAVASRHPSRLPVQTRIEETVLDLAEISRNLDQAFGWLTKACGRRLTTPGRIGAVLYQRRRTRWRRELLDALGDVASGCHSLLELRYLRDVERRHGLPVGQRQRARPRRGGRWYDDVRYEEFATLVELDGRAAHPEEFRSRDRWRDNAATVDGLSVLRYGTAEVTERACATAAEVALALRRNGWAGHPRRCNPQCLIDLDPVR